MTETSLRRLLRSSVLMAVARAVGAVLTMIVQHGAGRLSEALTNAGKHGEGPMTNEMSDAPRELTFKVSDSGPGFDVDQDQRGSGLDNIADRLDSLGGDVTIESHPGSHTALSGVLPIGIREAVTG